VQQLHLLWQFLELQTAAFVKFIEWKMQNALSWLGQGRSVSDGTEFLRVASATCTSVVRRFHFGHPRLVWFEHIELLL